LYLYLVGDVSECNGGFAKTYDVYILIVFLLKLIPSLHEKEVHLDTATKYPCLRCGRVFNRKHNLKLHMDRHMKYDLIGKGMRKSRDPPIRDKKFKKNVSIIEEPRGNEASNSLSAPPPDLLLYPPQFLSHP